MFKIWQSLTLILSIVLCSSTFFRSLDSVYAQACTQTPTSIEWSQPPLEVDVTAEGATRWPIDASIRIGFKGDWCPTPEEVELTNPRGEGVPATLTVTSPDQFVTNRPIGIQILTINPAAPLEPRTDYILKIKPNQPATPQDERYEIQFRTANTSVETTANFTGIDEVLLSGDLCFGSAYIPEVNDPECPTPARLLVKLNFYPLSRVDLSYAFYRASYTPLGPEALQPMGDERLERPIAFAPGIKEADSERPSYVIVELPYAPFPRQDCFYAVALDPYGRELGGRDTISCLDIVPFEDEGSGCEWDEPAADFSPDPPVRSLSCDPIGIHGGSSTPVTPPPLTQLEDTDDADVESVSDEPSIEEMVEEDIPRILDDDDPSPAPTTAASCRQTQESPSLWIIFFLFFCISHRLLRTPHRS